MKKSKVRKTIKWLLIIGVVVVIPISIVWYGWANTFFVIVPPGEIKSFPDGAIVWSYYDDRADRLISVDFIQEIDFNSVAVLFLNRVMSDFRPMVFPYSERIHKLVSEDIGQSLFDVLPDEKQDEKQEPVPEPEIEELNNWENVEMERC